MLGQKIHQDRTYRTLNLDRRHETSTRKKTEDTGHFPRHIYQGRACGTPLRVKHIHAKNYLKNNTQDICQDICQRTSTRTEHKGHLPGQKTQYIYQGKTHRTTASTALTPRQCTNFQEKSPP